MTACQYGSFPLPDSAAWLVEAVAVLQSSYAAMHPTIAVLLCLAGTAMNVTTVAVLTRPTMMSPVNVLLCAIALCDIVVMSFLFVFVSHFLIASPKRCEAGDYSYSWALFLFVHSQATVVLHATSLWLTVLLAQIRVLTIRRATHAPTEALSCRATASLAFLTLLITSAVNIPNVLTFKISTLNAELWLPCLHSEDYVANDDKLDERIANSSHPDSNIQAYGVIYHLQPSTNDCELLKLSFWTNGLLFKVIPCFLLTLSIVALLKIIADVSDRRRSLAQVMNKRKMPRDHTTPMLVAVLSIFLVAELPQGMLHVCNAVFSNDTFYEKIYLPLGDLLDLLSLLNSAVNFIIYCAMSRKFRIVFLQLIRPCLPVFIVMRLRDELEGTANQDLSRHRRSAITDLTKTDQNALNSRRISSGSLLMRSVSRDNLATSKMFGSTYLGSLVTPKSDERTLHSEAFDVRNSLATHELRIIVPTLNGSLAENLSNSSANILQNLFNRVFYFLRQQQPVEMPLPPVEMPLPPVEMPLPPDSKETAFNSSPERRLNILQAETNHPGY